MFIKFVEMKNSFEMHFKGFDWGLLSMSISVIVKTDNLINILKCRFKA